VRAPILERGVALFGAGHDDPRLVHMDKLHLVDTQRRSRRGQRAAAGVRPLFLLPSSGVRVAMIDGNLVPVDQRSAEKTCNGHDRGTESLEEE
jgi:hypothetical protein